MFLTPTPHRHLPSPTLLSTDRVQDMLPPNTAPCRIAFFQLKESEKRQVCEGLSDLLKQVRNPSVRGDLPTRGGKKHPHLQSQRDTERNLNEPVLLSFPHFTLLISYPLSYGIFPRLSSLHQTWHKNTFSHCFGSSFPYAGSCVT